MDKKQTTAQDIYNYVKCPHRVYLDGNGDPKEKSEVNLFVKLLWEKGLQTEVEYLETISVHQITDLSKKGVKEAWVETQRLMEKGAELIYQGCLRHRRYLGRPATTRQAISIAAKKVPKFRASKGLRENVGEGRVINSK